MDGRTDYALQRRRLLYIKARAGHGYLQRSQCIGIPGFFLARSQSWSRAVDPTQLVEYIIRPALRALGDKYASPSAERLLLATAAQESACGRYVRQIGGGPACGPYQMEGATLGDLYASYLAYYPDLIALIGVESAERLVYDWRYATQVARLQYWRDPDPLPAADNHGAMYAYYKRRWNTALGAATYEQFVDNWNRYVIV